MTRPAAELDAPSGVDAPDGRAGVRGPRWRRAARWPGGSRALRVAAVTATMVAATQAVAAGYEMGRGEQVLLSVKGISWADPTAYVNDWFNDRAPQPHVLFDVITYLGERAGVLPAVYLAYWLTSLVVLAAAVTLLTDVWLPRRVRGLELLVGALLVTGPYFALGTFLVVHREAVPNGLGGALGALTVALLVRGRDRAAVVAAAVTTAVHVQHGTVVAGALLVAWLVDPGRLRRPVVRWFPVAVLGILAAVVAVASARGLVSGSADVVAVCETASPGHCDPDSWSWATVRDGLVVLALGLAAPLLARPVPRRALALLVAPTALVVVALVADLAGIEPLQTWGRQFFLYRFVMGVAPFAPVAVVMLLGRAAGRPGRRSALAAVAGVAAMGGWHWLSHANLWRFRSDATSAVLVSAGLGAACCLGFWLVTRVGTRVAVAQRPGAPRRRVLRAVPAVLTAGVALAVALLLGFGARATGWVPLRVDPPSDGALDLGRRIEELTPPGSVLAARPDAGWLRLLSRRGVVVDCKGVPYGGQPWQEYNERLAALGVQVPLECTNEGFAALTAEDVVRLGERYGATHVLLDPTDTTYDVASAGWASPGDLGGPTRLFEIPAAP